MNLDELDEAWQVLTDREKTVITKRFGLENGAEPQTLKATGKSLGVSGQHIRQIQSKALCKLRRAGLQLEKYGEIKPFLRDTNLPLPKPKAGPKPVVKRKKKPEPLPLPVTVPVLPPAPKCSERKRLNWLERWIAGSGTAIRRGIDGIGLYDQQGCLKLYAKNLRALIDLAINRRVFPGKKL